MIRAKLFAPLAVIAIAVGGATVLVVSRPSPEPVEPEHRAPYVQVVEAHPGPVDMLVESQGTVSPRTVADLVPEVSGQVVWTSANLVAGGYFDENEPLLRIDGRDYGIALDEARAAVDRAEAEREFAQLELQRLREIEERRLISRADLESGVRAARVADAALAEAAARLERAELDVERTEVRAPFVGVVQAEQVDTGQFVSRGAPIASLFAVDYVEVRLPVADSQLAWLDLPLERRGELDPASSPRVSLTAEYAGRQRRWEGAVVRTEAEIDVRSRMVHLVARIDARDVGEGDAVLPPPVGLFMHAEILGRSAGNVVVLPRSALRGGNRMLVVDAGERLRFRSVEVMRIEGEDAYVSAGLDAGDRVCVSPLQAVVDGMRVQIAGGPEGYGSGE